MQDHEALAALKPLFERERAKGREGTAEVPRWFLYCALCLALAFIKVHNDANK